MEELPKFKYNPNVLKLGIIKKENINCPVCNKDRDYVYEGPFYSVQNVEGICPWCINDGSASKKYEGEFQDSASCEEVEKDEYREELLTKTPSYSGWQQEQWLSHCGGFCGLEAYGGWFITPRSVYIYEVTKCYGIGFRQEKIKLNLPVPKKYVRMCNKL